MNTLSKKDVTAIEVQYIGGKRRMFKLNNAAYRERAIELQSKVESYPNVFRVYCHTVYNMYL